MLAWETQLLCSALECGMAGLTDVNGFKEGPIHGSTDGVRSILAEHDMATIVAVIEGRQDVLRIIRAIAICLNDTLLCPI